MRPIPGTPVKDAPCDTIDDNNSMKQMIHPVLLCGGSGTRLWPLSRESYPKQFAQITGKGSMFQASAQRLSGSGFAAPIVITGNDFRFIVLEQLAAIELVASDILIEPAARDTAPAILVGALALEAQKADTLMLVAPSDHIIPDPNRFGEVVKAAIPAAQEGRIVSFGIRPDRPETGYGWLELSKDPEIELEPTAQPLKSFFEKPDAEAAQAMLDDGKYLWNAGIFLFSVDALIAAFKEHQPEMLRKVRMSFERAETDLSFTRLASVPWCEIEEKSIDYAVMEKAQNLSVVPYGGAWSDLGSWEAVWRESDHEANGLVTYGPVTAIECENTLLRAEDQRQQLVGLGLSDIVVVAMPDAVLVARKDRAEDVKYAVQVLKAHDIAQAETLPRAYRPWGWFECLAIGSRFQVKRIVVHPGASLSLQRHHHRSEHWIVVQGTAKVTVDDENRLVTENQSVFIPLGAVHRMENPGKVDMILIEVQTGSYLGEDDIVRFDDVYARGDETKG